MNRSKQAGMGTRAFVALLVGLILASVHLVEAQQPTRIPRIGYLSGTPTNPRHEAFRQGLPPESVPSNRDLDKFLMMYGKAIKERFNKC